MTTRFFQIPQFSPERVCNGQRPLREPGAQRTMSTGDEQRIARAQKWLDEQNRVWPADQLYVYTLAAYEKYLMEKEAERQEK